MVEIEARLDELSSLGLRRRTRLVSGPQGAHVLLDGRPVLLLCSNNYLGLADHPSIREAAADAAMRWGVGAGASRLVSGTMTIHRRLEQGLADFQCCERALLFGSGYLANTGIVSALARPGDVIFSDALNHASIVDGCRLSRAEVFVYDHCDVEHLRWGIERAEGRGTLIVTDGVFSMDGDIAPLAEIAELAARFGLRTVVDEAHATGTIGPGGRGAVAAAGLEDEIDVIVGTLGKALGTYGAFAACDAPMARYLTNAARTFIFSTALPPPVVAGALAALDLLSAEPRRVQRLAANAATLRDALAAEGLEPGDSATPIVSIVIGDAAKAVAVSETALERGVFAQAICPPAVPEHNSRLRLAVMATHRERELREAARTIGAVLRSVGVVARSGPRAAPETPAAIPERRETEVIPAAAHAPAFDVDATPGHGTVFDVDAVPTHATVFDVDAAPARRAA
jgi:8-amino-7-oxononanoate synthase